MALTLFTEHDIYLFKKGSHFRLYDKLGAHITKHEDKEGVYFAVWVPNTEHVFVIGDFNNWDTSTHPFSIRRDDSGIWEGFIPGIKKGMMYKYHVQAKHDDYHVDKSDPYGFAWEISPLTSTKVWELSYVWHDAEWMQLRQKKNNLNAPISIYEVHPGSWRRVHGEKNRYLTYREMAGHLVSYLKEMGFTHVEFMPVMTHPFYGSWGYQITGYYAPASRYGIPQDSMYLIDRLHQNEIGVFLDWVPSHFPSDEQDLIYGDGTHLYEHADARKGFHPEWKSYIFNHGRNEVRDFLIGNALFWLDKYHVDGLRLDAVPYLYEREGTNCENLPETHAFLKKFRIHGDYHLGQVLFTGKDFIIIDFEGEPAGYSGERRLKRSSLRDITGMIRSFHYLTYSGLIKQPIPDKQNLSSVMPWIEVWYNYVSNVFLRSYMQTVKECKILPQKTGDFSVLFNLFLLEKAVYELDYELNNRPDWIEIPIKGIKHVLGV